LFDFELYDDRGFGSTFIVDRWLQLVSKVRLLVDWFGGLGIS